MRLRDREQSALTTIYKATARRVLFGYRDPEDAHKAAIPLLSRAFPMSLIRNLLDEGNDRLSVNLRDKVFLDGPIGLAAGFDKDAQMIQGLSQIFDYVTVGTMLPYDWPGNPKRAQGNLDTARIVRLPGERSMLNCLGFPFGGLLPALRKIDAYTGNVPINLSIAVRPPKEGQTMQDVITQFEKMVRTISQHAANISMLEPNFASPNTKGLAVFFEKGVLEDLAKIIIDTPALRGKLLLLKMPPHLDREQRKKNIEVVERWTLAGGDGITAINTVRTEDSRLSMGVGGKSGRAIFDIMMANLSDYKNAFNGTIVINAVGGIIPQSIPEVLMKGADTVQVFTDFIYTGPGYVLDGKRAILKEIKRKDTCSLGELKVLW